MFRMLSSYGIAMICTLNWLTTGNDVIPTKVDISKATETNMILLNCTVSNSSATLTWSFQSSSSEDKKMIPTNNITFVISSSDQTGTYDCAVEGSVICKFIAWNFSKPFIPHTGRSIVWTEGSVNQTVECFAFSYPRSSITWTVDFTDSLNPVNLSGTDSNKFSIKETVPGWSILTVSIVAFSDRGTYSCIAERKEPNSTDSAHVLIRIHGRLAPLWPFLGIVCEILIIVCIIVVVKRKSATAEKGLGSPFQDSNSSETSQDAINPSVRFRGERS